MHAAGREDYTITDMIARAVFVTISKIYSGVDALSRRNQRNATERTLRQLPDAMLHDIGLARADIPKEVSLLQTPGR
jgi:uncharacterized protein YjiS (DUF1127 family)